MSSKNCHSPQLPSSKPEDQECSLDYAIGGSPYSYGSYLAVEETRTSALVCEEGIFKATWIRKYAKLMFPGLWCMHHSESRIVLTVASYRKGQPLSLHHPPLSQGGTSW